MGILRGRRDPGRQLFLFASRRPKLRDADAYFLARLRRGQENDRARGDGACCQPDRGDERAPAALEPEPIEKRVQASELDGAE